MMKIIQGFRGIKYLQILLCSMTQFSIHFNNVIIINCLLFDSI
jgi:hypothetical protein